MTGQQSAGRFCLEASLIMPGSLRRKRFGAIQRLETPFV